MYAQVQYSGSCAYRARSTRKGNCLYTPTYIASDREEVESTCSSDFSDDDEVYYSDSGYPTLPRPKLVLWTSSSPSPPLTHVPQRGDSSTLGRIRRKTVGVLPVNGLRETTSSHARSRKLSVITPPATLPSTRETLQGTKNKAFNKLRSLRNNRILPASSTDHQRPPSSLVTNSISANGKSSPSSPLTPADGVTKQLRSISLPAGDSDTCIDMAQQVKTKKTKKVSRAISFSFGSGDRKRRARNIFGALGRGGRGDVLADSEPLEVKRSPVLVGRRGGTATIYEEDRSSLSSVEEQDDRLNYLRGNKFGSCRELTMAGLDDQPQLLRPLSKRKHKRPSLPSFTKIMSGTPAVPPGQLASLRIREAGEEDVGDRSSGSPADDGPSPPASVVSTPSPSQGRVLRRKLSDPGSAPSTPEPGTSPMMERRISREEGGVVRGGRPLRKGFTFSVGGANVSPNWVRIYNNNVCYYMLCTYMYIHVGVYIEI